MAGRIFGPRVYGPRVYGRVFGGVGAGVGTAFGWQHPLREEYAVPARPKHPFLYAHPQGPIGWIATAVSADLQVRTPAFQAERNQEYRLRARPAFSLSTTSWRGSNAWISAGFQQDMATTLGWLASLSIRDLPPLTKRGVRHTVHDPGWIFRAIPATPIADPALLAAMFPEKGGLPPLSRAKAPSLRYEWLAQMGWLWDSVVRPVILAGSPAWTAHSQHTYLLRARTKGPYLPEWKPQVGWMLGAGDSALFALVPSMTTQMRQEYRLRARAVAPYMQEWASSFAWVVAGIQEAARTVTGVTRSQMQTEYRLRARAPFPPAMLSWSDPQAWEAIVALQRVITQAVAAQAQLRLPQAVPRGVTRGTLLYEWISIMKLLSLVPPPSGTGVRRIIGMGSVTNTGR